MKSVIDKRIKEYFKKKGLKVTDKNLPEIKESLSHLGKAIFLQ